MFWLRKVYFRFTKTIKTNSLFQIIERNWVLFHNETTGLVTCKQILAISCPTSYQN